MLDDPEPATVLGLNLQCTPGNDVKCVTEPGGRRQFWMLRDSLGLSGAQQLMAYFSFFRRPLLKGNPG